MFRNRYDAGQRLGETLASLELENPLVLGIPRGGVVTGAAIATRLGAELDVVLARKLRAPFQPELALGAVGEDGNVYLNPEVMEMGEVLDEHLERERRRQLAEIARRREMFRAVRPPASIAGRSVILADDGIATGSTMIAAIDVVKAQRPHEIIVAVPVAPPERLEEIRHRCDRVDCLLTPKDFWAVGDFYADFRTVEDDEVVELLRAFAPPAPRAGKEQPLAANA